MDSMPHAIPWFSERGEVRLKLGRFNSYVRYGTFYWVMSPYLMHNDHDRAETKETPLLLDLDGNHPL